MSRYIKSFENDAAIQSAIDNGVLSKPYVAYDESANTIDWNSKISFKEMPLTFEIISGGTLYFYASTTGTSRTIEYSKNGSTWTSVTSNNNDSGATICEVQAGDKIYFSGNSLNYAESVSSNIYTSIYNCFKSDAILNVYGNILSLCGRYDDYNSRAFVLLFNNLNIISAENLILPSFGAYSYAFVGMFYSCTTLTTPPALPATTLSQSCYGRMFEYCTSLITAPELPATTLKNSCYGRMFYGCTSLISANILAQETDTSCMANMFDGCSSLNYIKCLVTTFSGNGIMNNWVYGVQTTSGTFVKKTGVNWNTGNSGIPKNWTVIEE